MNSHDDESNNRSGNTPFSTIFQNSINRRRTLQAGLAGTVVGLFHSKLALAQEDPVEEALINFTPLRAEDAKGDLLAISEDYEFEVVFPWGDPIRPDGPAFTFPARPDYQPQQIGIGHDGMWFFENKPPDPMQDPEPVPDPEPEGEVDPDMEPEPDPDPETDPGYISGVLCLNHEFGSNGTVIGESTPENIDQVRTSQYAHGVSILDIAKVEGKWQVVEGCYGRRIHVNTPVAFGGTARDYYWLFRGNSRQPMGTLNNCGSGPTPWRTYLTCEENFQGYFGTQKSNWEPNEYQRRYGFSDSGFGYGWHLFDKRFDIGEEEGTYEANRFGWVVEIDPFDTNAMPVKRTSLGRFKHEAACVTISESNRAVVYMGDDSNNEYIYKFVGEEDHLEVLERGESPLDEGILYAAKFNSDNTGEWLPLTPDNKVLQDELRGQKGILTFTRIAGDLAGATPMDRPEWLTLGGDCQVYCALTNNTGKSEANSANPENPNLMGHILRIDECDDRDSTAFTWDIFKIASETAATEEAFGSPDSVYADPDGRLFILTDGGQPQDLNNQLLVADTNTGEIRRLFSGVPGCEITGITHTDDRREYFVNVQHPGTTDPHFGFPTLNRFDREVKRPRDATVVIRRKDGGIVGS